MKLTRQKSKVAARLLERQSVIVNPKNIELISRDPFDDYIIAAAIIGKVKYLITEDEDLLALKTHRGVDIMTPGKFRNRVSG
jgi:putative PIN family toxin of toxin-antitoxin system